MVGGMSEWRPIDSAPKDGSAVLLFGGEGCFGWTPPANMADLPLSISRWSEDRWVEATGEQYQPHDGPTHWMPLPDPPR